MAIVFELVADFLGNKDHAEICCKWLAARTSPVTIDRYNIALHPPFVSGSPYNEPTQFQVAVVPENVGCRVALDKGNARVPLTDDQVSRLGNYLFELIRGAPHYKLAMVGWDVDYLLDLDELNADWATEIRDGELKGLVVETSLLEQLPRSDFFVPFDDNHHWIPYAGSQAIAT